MVWGVEGKKPPTGTSLFKSWQAFEDETSYLWINAKQFNEDGSEIVQAVEKMRVSFPKSFAPVPTTDWEIGTL